MVLPLSPAELPEEPPKDLACPSPMLRPSPQPESYLATKDSRMNSHKEADQTSWGGGKASLPVPEVASEHLQDLSSTLEEKLASTLAKVLGRRKGAFRRSQGGQPEAGWLRRRGPESQGRLASPFPKKRPQQAVRMRAQSWLGLGNLAGRWTSVRPGVPVH